MEYYCPVCDRTFSEPETVSAPPFRKCPVCGFTLASRPARRDQRTRLAELEQENAAMRPLVHALATMLPVVVNGVMTPCPWCLERGRHAEGCPVTLAQHVEAAWRA
jgi:hypothetical protein